MIVACATDDSSYFPQKHFGDCIYFDIYNLSREGFNFIKRIDNPMCDEIEEKEAHDGDPIKAKKLFEVLSREQVTVMMANQMGKNILRMKINFVPVISREKEIKKSLEKLLNIYDKVEAEIVSIGEKKHIILS